MQSSPDPGARPRGQAASVGRMLGPVLFLTLLLWPDLPLTADQRRVAAITAWTAVWWITAAIPIGAASLLPAVLLPLPIDWAAGGLLGVPLGFAAAHGFLHHDDDGESNSTASKMSSP